MKKAQQTFRKALIGLAGFLLLLVGIILIPLPGPGLLVCFLALLLLSKEFDWASKHADNVKTQVRNISTTVRKRTKGSGDE